MHVKEQVKEFVHDVKRKFSQKHKRDTCSTFNSHEYSSADTFSHLDDSSSSSVSSLDVSERSRLIKFIRPRTSSTASKKQHNVLHKVKRVGSKRYRLFSAPTVPSERMVEPHHKQAVSYQGPETSGSMRGMVEERVALGPSQDYSDVIDISAPDSVKTGSGTPELEGSQSSSRRADRDSMSQPSFDTVSRSDTSGTLVTATSPSAHKKSISESDSVDLHSDINSDRVHDSVPLALTPTLPMADLPPVSLPTPALLPREEEIIIAQASPAMAPSSPQISQAPRTATPAQLVRSTAGSPVPVYIPRLTAPSMFLPIPNVDPSVILCAHAFASICVPTTGVVAFSAHPSIPILSAPKPPSSTIATLEAMVLDQLMPFTPHFYRSPQCFVDKMSNSWRALAKMARDRIVASDPEDLGRILDLWSLRLSALARLRLTNQASAECTNLFAVLNAVPATSVPGTFPGSSYLPPPLPSSPALAPAAPSPLSPSGLGGLAQLPGTPSQKSSALPSSSATTRQSAHELVHPFELTVFHARVHYWSGDPLGYVDALGRILARCKKRAREEGRVVVQRRELAKAAKEGAGGDVESSTRSEQVSEDGNGDESEDEAEEDGKEDVEESTGSAEVQDGEEETPDDVLVAAEANLSMWLERIARVCLMLASQMIEMNDYQAAINLLSPLCTHRVAPTFLPTPTPELHSALARIYLLSGNLQKAEEHFSIAASAAANNANGADVIATNTALLAAASGDWTRAEAVLSEMVTKDPGNLTAINNLAVTLLSQGRVKEGIDLLEAALKTSPSSVVVAEPFLFNLSTLYELRSTAAIDKKRGLLIEVSKWSGDGLKTSCLKMPSS